ncbi:MAG: 7TM diverse intracellular signaling domain-containing protein, partial [Syntrophomonadaceae bacterium]|nr:7TM diverse intracellular signaling domain-containing protein [Syntrophomonadaceae bacterium]
MRFETQHNNKGKPKQAPKNLLYYLLLLLLLFIMLPSHVAEANTAAPVRKSDTIPEIEYFEDKSGNLSFEQIRSPNLSGSFQLYPDSTVSEGINRSSWWFRLRPGDGEMKDDARYISINNAYIEKAVLYLPDTTADREGHMVLNSGWHFKSQTQDEGFLYPVFKIPQTMDVNADCFLQIQSAYTHNYQIQVLNSKQYDYMRLHSLLFLGGMLGILLAMILYNLIIYFFLRDRTYLYYVIYVLMMFFYQMELLGLIRLLNHQLSEVLIAHVSVLGFITIISLLVFVRSFLDTAKIIPGYDRFLKVLMCIPLFGIVLMIGGWKLEANVMSLYVTNLTAVLILFAGIASLRQGVRQARWFLIAWSVMIVGGIVFSLRGWGWLPQNNLTIHMLLITAVVESILLSVALADRIRLLQMEKEAALGLYKE